MPTPIDAYDVVVIGGGLAGASIARRLAEAAQKVVILESQAAAGGLAPRGVGLALLGTPEPYAALQARRGDDARQIWELTRENLALLSQTLQAAGLEVHRTGSLRLTDDAQEAQQFQQSATLLQALGYAVTLEDATDWGQLVALRTEDDIVYDPAVLIAALLQHPNITLETEAEVQAIKPQAPAPGAPPRLTIWARKHYLWAKTVVLTGGALAVRLSATLQPLLHPTRIHSLDLVTDAPLPQPLLLAGGQMAATATPEGWRLAAWMPQDHPDALQGLLDKVKPLCPQAIVRRRHSGWGAQSVDGLPIVGALPEWPNVYLLNGLGAWGASWAWVAAARLAELLLQQQDPGEFSIQRFR